MQINEQMRIITLGMKDLYVNLPIEAIIKKKAITHYVTHDTHHSQTHSQQRTLTQHDMLPQHPVNIMELFCEFLK